MERKQINTDMGVELLQPRAAPVDTFVQPARSGLRDFAEALSKIDRPLKQFLDARAEKQADEDRIRGEAAFYDDNSEDIAELVRSGKVPAQYSPNFVKGFKNAQGNVAGNKLRSEFNAAFDAWEGKNSDDPEAYDKFVAGFLKERLETEDPEVLRGLMPHIRQVAETGNALYTKYRHDQTVQGSLDAHIAGANQDIDELNREGLSTEEGTNYPVVFQKIEEKRAQFIATGGNPEVFDKSMVDAMSAKILSTRDPGLLAWFDQKVPGKEYTYGESPYGSKVKLETTESLEVIARRSFAEDAAKQKAADEQRKDDAQRAAIEFLSHPENAAKPIPDGILKQGEVDPTFKVRVEEWRKTLGSGFSDPARIKDVYNDILAGGGYKAVQKAFAQGVFGRPEDLTAAYAFAKSFEDSRDRITQTMSSATAERFMKDLDIRTKGVNEMTGDPIVGTSNEGYEAQYDYRRLVTDWVVRNPDATPAETEEAISKIGKGIMDRLQLPEGAIEGDAAKTYERPADLGFDNPFSDGTAPAPNTEEPPATTTEPAPTPGEEEDQKGDVEDFLNGLTPEQKADFDSRAKAFNMSPEDLAKQLLTPKEKAKPINFVPSEQGATVQNASLVAAQPRGLEALVSSGKRGTTPDLSNLRPEIVNGVSTLQAAWGKDLPIVSGFREKARNKKAGGAKHSQHLSGNAVDIDVAGMKPAEQVKLIRLASEQGFTGIGVYGNSIHLDYGGRRYWGPDHHKESLPGWARSVMAEHINRQGAAPSGGPTKPFKFDQKAAMAFLDDALVELPEDLSFSGSTNIEGDPVASRLGNLIGQHEGNGNYNAISGNANSSRDLSQYSVNQIIGMQAGAKARGQLSSAVGKYQFLRKTLKGLRTDLGLTGNEKFTPKLQDRMFHALLVRRGYNEYRAGKLSKRAFALRLSQEWASLPDPSTGRSYYAGDGVHGRTRAKPRDVYAAIGMEA